MTDRANLEGLDVQLYRDSEGVLTVDIATGGLAESDQDEDGIPNIRLWINEAQFDGRDLD